MVLLAIKQTEPQPPEILMGSGVSQLQMVIHLCSKFFLISRKSILFPGDRMSKNCLGCPCPHAPASRWVGLGAE